MDMIGAELVQRLATWHVQRRTGAVEWRDEKRRRLFFFRDGELELVQSNLKSESSGRILEQLSNIQGDLLDLAYAEARLRGALAEVSGKLVEHADAPPPERQPAPFLKLLWCVVAFLPHPSGAEYPRARAAGVTMLRRLPVAPEMIAVLLELDGTRTVEDVLEFSPVEPSSMHDAIAIGMLLGLIDVAAVETEASTVQAATPAWMAQSRSGGAVPALVEHETAEVVPNQPVVHRPAPETTIAEMLASVAMNPPAPPSASAPLTPPAPPIPSAPAVSGPRMPIAGDPVSVHEVVLGRKPETIEDKMGPVVHRIRTAANHFVVLGCRPEDDFETLRVAYVRIARELHPDVWTRADAGVRRDAEALFERLREAWEVLADDAARDVYIRRVIRGEKSEEDKAQDRVRLIMEAEVEFKRGLSEFQSGRMVQARELFASASAKVPEDQEMKAYSGYASFRVYAGRSPDLAQQGVHELQDALRANERLDSGYVLLGLVHWAQGNENAAKQCFVQALRIKPSNPDALRELKRLQRSSGEASPQDSAKDRGFLSKLFGKK